MSDTGIVTLLFTDLVSSTELLERLGDDEAEAMRRTHFGLLRNAVASAGGTEVKTLGDGLMVAFTSAAQGLRSAVAMQQAVAAHNRRSPVQLEVRIGMHVGEPMRDEEDYFGTPVVVAKRLCDRASGGQILVSHLVPAVVPGEREFSFRDVGPLTLKGLAAPIEVRELTWRPQTPAAPALPGALHGAASAEFVGRSGEVARLVKVWRDVVETGRRTVFVAGEPGIGKTRLATELAQQVHAESAQVLYGRCDEGLGVPYQPFVEALGQHFAQTSAPTGRVLAPLRRLFPDLASDAAPVVPLDPEPDADRFLLFEAIVDVLASATDAAPTLLVLDDLHWAATPTVLLLRHLVRSPRPMPLLLLGTYRDTELNPEHPLTALLADLRREPDVERMTLRGIETDDVEALIRAEGTLGDGDVAELAHAVRGETGGNPFFVRELVAHLAETGSHRPFALPEGVRDVIRRRIGRLSQAAQTTLQRAAVIGTGFGVRLLETIVAADQEIDVLDVLDEATAAGLVTEDGPDYAFAHALIRQTLSGELSTARRARLHRQVGDALETLHGGDPPVDLAAYHFLEAGSEDQAVRYALAAAARAEEALAFEKAIALVDRAIAVVGDRCRDDVRADLFLALSTAHAGASEFDISRKMALRAADAARAAGSAGRLARAAILYNDWGNLALGLPDPQAAPLCEAALEALGDRDVSLRVQLLCHLALYLFWSEGAVERAHALAEEALALARGLDNPELLSLALHAVATSLDGSHRVLERLAHVREQQALPNRGKFASDSLYGEGIALIELGDRAGVERVIADLRSLPAAVQGWWRPRCWALVFEAILALMDGRFDEVEPLAEEALALWSSPDGMNTYAALLLMLRREQGRGAEMLPLLEDIAKAPAFRPVLAWLYAELDDRDGAARVLRAAAGDDFAEVPRGATWGASLCFLGTAAVAAEDGDSVRWLYDQLRPHSGHLIMTGHGGFCAGAADTFLGTMAGFLGERDTAVDHFERALALEKGMGATALAARTRRAYQRSVGR